MGSRIWATILEEVTTPLSTFPDIHLGKLSLKRCRILSNNTPRLDPRIVDHRFAATAGVAIQGTQERGMSQPGSINTVDEEYQLTIVPLGRRSQSEQISDLGRIYV